MKTMLIACETIKCELDKASEDTGIRYETLWIDPGLHDLPGKLKAAFQDCIDTAAGAGAERLLVGLGFCGNSIIGVRSGPCELIIPRVDDCVTMMLGTFTRRKAIMDEGAAFFMTPGFCGKGHMWQQYLDVREKYDDEDALDILETMLGNYKRFIALDVGAGDLADTVEKTKTVADYVGLPHEVIKGSCDYMKELITGPWPDGKFLTVPAGAEITASDLVMKPPIVA